MTRRTRSWIGPLLAAGALLLLSACFQDQRQDWLRPASNIARDIGSLWNVVFWAAAAVFFLVEGALLYLLFRFRARKGDPSEPVQTHGNTRVEIAWTIAPAILLAVLTVPTVATIFAIAAEPDDPVRVNVLAKQWWWEYTYADSGVVTANELHIPVGRDIFLTLESEDVIHSYWVPKLAGKQDVVPGRTNHLTIRADEVGEFYGQCLEYCGLSHANMRLRVISHEPGDFTTWLAGQQQGPQEPRTDPEREGARLFAEGECIGCHTIEGVSEATVGPNLTHFAARGTFAGSIFDRSDENLAEWLRDPPGVKPGSKMPNLGLSEDDITALVAYLQSLE